MSRKPKGRDTDVAEFQENSEEGLSMGNSITDYLKNGVHKLLYEAMSKNPVDTLKHAQRLEGMLNRAKSSLHDAEAKIHIGGGEHTAYYSKDTDLDVDQIPIKRAISFARGVFLELARTSSVDELKALHKKCCRYQPTNARYHGFNKLDDTDDFTVRVSFACFYAATSDTNITLPIWPDFHAALVEYRVAKVEDFSVNYSRDLDKQENFQMSGLAKQLTLAPTSGSRCIASYMGEVGAPGSSSAKSRMRQFMLEMGTVAIGSEGDVLQDIVQYQKMLVAKPGGSKGEAMDHSGLHKGKGSK